MEAFGRYRYAPEAPASGVPAPRGAEPADDADDADPTGPTEWAGDAVRADEAEWADDAEWADLAQHPDDGDHGAGTELAGTEPAEPDDAEPLVPGPRPPAEGSRRRARRAAHSAARSRRSPAAVLAMTAALLLAPPVAFMGGGSAVTALARVAGVVVEPQRPALADDAAAVPLGTAPPAPEGRGGFRFLDTQDRGGQPVRWDPCRPIHYVVRPDGAPPGGDAAIASSVARMERLTGLRFVHDGSTTEVPRDDRATMDPGRYGKRWSPVLVAWTDPREYPGMAGYAGLGGPDAVSGKGRDDRRYVTGVVLLNRDHLTDVAGWPRGQERLEAVVLHEFGHLVGLDHVDDPDQLMYRRPIPVKGVVGDGDRRGLAQLGRGRCFRDF